MSLVDDVKFMQDYLNKTGADLTKSLATNNLRAKNEPSSAVTDQIQKNASQSSLDAVQSNPIINSGGTIVAQYVGSVSQSLTNSLITKVNLSPIQNVTQQFFSMFASFTTLGPEIAMELARNTARNLLTQIAARDAIITQLNTEYTALYNTSVVLLNGVPFFNDLVNNVIQALKLLNTSNDNLATIVTVLQKTQRYRVLTFNQVIKDMTSARDLLLPPSNGAINARSITGLADQVTGLQSLQKVATAALSIPLISQKIGSLSIEYIRLTEVINGLISVFTTSYSDFITGYAQNPNINQATIDHLNAARSQLDSLTSQMTSLLQQNPNNPNDATYKVKLTANTTVWGLQTTSILEWLKLNPGVASASLTQTSESVVQYTKAITTITALSTIKFTGGQVTIAKGQEDFSFYLKYSTQILQSANTIVATNTSRLDIRQQTNTILSYLRSASSNTSQIKSAINPFISTQTTLSGDAKKAVQLLTATANQFGLDRVAGILMTGDVKSLLSLTPDTTTSVGSCIAGLNGVISGLTTSGKATDQLVQKVTATRDQFSREKKTQEIEASRSSDSTIQAENAQAQAKQDNNTNMINSAIGAANTLDASAGQDGVGQASTSYGKIIPGFTQNKGIL